MQLNDTEVSISLDELQFGLRAVSSMKEYLDDNPGKMAAVGAVLTMVQAPKAILRTLVDLALAGTTLGEALSEKLGEMQTLLGKAIAQQIEGEQLDPDEDGGQFLIGGGELLVGILSGSVVGGKKGKGVDRGRVKDDGQGAKGISITIEPKIADQMGKRGWTESSIQSAIDNPVKTVVTKDTRFDTVSGSRLNDPATGYVTADGSYVVRNDRTGAIVQVSNKNDPKWVAPWN